MDPNWTKESKLNVCVSLFVLLTQEDSDFQAECASRLNQKVGPAYRIAETAMKDMARLKADTMDAEPPA